MIAMKNCSASFIRNQLKDQINFDQIMIHHPLVKEMSILGSSFLCLYGTYLLTESEQGGAAGASSHSLNNGRNMSNDQ